MSRFHAAVVSLLALLFGSVVGAGPTTPRTVAVSWVTAMRLGNQALACELQTEQQVGGIECAKLPRRRIFHGCRGPLPSVLARTSREQVGPLDGNKVWITAERRSSYYRARLELAPTESGWRVGSITRLGQVFQPAGTIEEGSPLPGHLWLSCERPIFPGR